MAERGLERDLSTVLLPFIVGEMIIYAIGARVSIARIFLAGIVPGIVIGLLLMFGIYIMATRNPQAFPMKRRLGLKDLFRVVRVEHEAQVKVAVADMADDRR